jgi:hypothetical protein
MKKLVIAALFALAAMTFANSIVNDSGRERVNGLELKTASKDTLWYTYMDATAFVWGIKAERATYFNVNDFGLEFPVNLHALSAYLYDSLKTYSYKIYDKDGTTVLFQSEQAVSKLGYNDLEFNPPLILNDNFWFSTVPQSDGLPRQVSSDVMNSDHSFYGGSGSWEPMIDPLERYEWANYVGLSPYEGGDTYAPSFRGITGTTNFLMIDADVTITIQDQSALATVTGEYNTGSGWTPLALTKGKSTYVYSGTIPGQAHGVNAAVRFYARDVNGYEANSEQYTVSWSNELPLLSEGFENIVFPPQDWTVQTVVGTGFARTETITAGTAYEGRATAIHYDEAGDNNNWLITPKISLPATGYCTFNFWQYGYWLNYLVDGYHEVAVSTDMTTWNVVYTGHPPVGETGAGAVWEKIIIALDEYSGSDVYVGFHYVGNYEDQWYIDDVNILYDDEGPQITSIEGNTALMPVLGAYLNNPLILNLTASDKSGTKAVKCFYDIGGIQGSVDFAQAKDISSNWAGAVPAQAAVATGTVYFELTDIGGMINTTGNYEIRFVTDNGTPEITDFSFGDPVLIGYEMPITVTFGDESAISSAVCYFSKDDWETQTSYPMTASKIHSYTYTCIIPAEAAETFAEVKFSITDIPGNVLNSGTYPVRWLKGEVALFDDFDANHNPDMWWWGDSQWGMVQNQYISANNSLHDSPSGLYPNNQTNPIMYDFMDFSTYYAATMYFWGKVDVEAKWDFVYLQGTSNYDALATDPVSSEWWTTLAKFDGDQMPWQYFSVNMGSLALQPTVAFRFVLVSDTYLQQDGMYIDDIKIIGYNEDYSPPIIVHDGPAQLQATGYTIPREFTIPVGMEDYMMYVDLIDISDISEVKVVYSVDGGPEQSALGSPSSGPSGEYTVTIPVQAAGSKVSYKIVAIDNSEYKNAGETNYYHIHFGNYMYYQNGDDFTDYLDMIGNGSKATAQAIATRVTMGPMDAVKGHYRSDLVGITIDNYIQLPEYPSAPMMIHVWEDANGMPGKDLIEPFYYEQASNPQWSYEITYVDLRPYADKLTGIEGDVYVGFTSTGDATNILYEVVANHIGTPGYVAFERSWLGSGDLDNLEWNHDPANVYHLSAVIGNYEYVDAPLPPRGFTVKNISATGYNELNWLANTAVDHYNIYRGNSPDFEVVTPIGSVLATDPSTYIDTTPPSGALYYKITAVDGGGIESSPTLALEPTGIQEENLPMVTELYQNYPNPFNPETTIKFNIAKDTHVNLSVYNTSGQLVVNVVNGNLRRGSHAVKFDGSKLTSGVYYTVLKADNKTMTGKMMLMK